MDDRCSKKVCGPGYVVRSRARVALADEARPRVVRGSREDVGILHDVELAVLEREIALTELIVELHILSHAGGAVHVFGLPLPGFRECEDLPAFCLADEPA